jgi:hypothetical protein
MSTATGWTGPEVASSNLVGCHMAQPKHALVRKDENGRAITRRVDAVKRIVTGGGNSNRHEAVEAEALRRCDEMFGRTRTIHK